MPALRGTVLGSYRVTGELSTGSMGTVFRAEHLLLGRPAAVKVLRRDLTADRELVSRFVVEAKAVAACKHPGIVEVYDYGHTPDGHAFIVMELLEGEGLGDRLARGPLAERAALAIAHGIAGALRAAHKVGVIHRDLKPDNVFLVADPDGGDPRVKVLDFGIAKLRDGAMRHTETGALIGTPMYMAPEQARAAATLDHRADLYALGCLLYHMLVGRPPFVAEGAGELIALQLFGQVEPPGRLAAIAPATERLVMALLEKDPAARPASAGDVIRALAEAAAGLGAPAVVEPAARRSTLPRLALAGALVVAGAGGAYAVVHSTARAGDRAAAPTAAPVSATTAAAAGPATTAAPADATSVDLAAPAESAPAEVAPAARPPVRAGKPAVPDRAIEILRDIRQADAPAPLPHTPRGSPMELDVDLRKPSKPAPPKDAPHP